MTVALLLGIVRVQEELAVAADLGANAEYLTAVPAAFELEASLYDLAQASASESDRRRPAQRVAASLQKMTEGGRSLEVDGQLTALIGQALIKSKSVLDDILAGGIAPARLVERINEISRLFKSALDSQVVVSEHQNVRDSGAEIDALWTARRALADQYVLFGTGRPDSRTRASIVAAAGNELAALDRAQSLGAISPNEADPLSTSARNRINNTAVSMANLTGEYSAFQDSRDTYQSLMDRAATNFYTMVGGEADTSRSAALRDTALVLGAVLAALAVGLIVARSLTDPIRRLRVAALHAANSGLPEVIDRIRSGEKVEDLDLPPVPVTTTEEIGQLARAIDNMHGQAVNLAGEQASLRQQVNDMFETLSRRNRSLVEQQLGLIEELERGEDDPQRLGNLFRLDHIAAKMRRNSDNLLVLAGIEGRKGRTAPILLTDAVRAAISGVEDYTRVELDHIPVAAIKGLAALDVVHLLTELLDNALRYSPPTSSVSVNAARSIDGAMIIEIADRGVGIADIHQANTLLTSGGTVNPETARKMGLFVVSRLSRRHGITVRLRSTGTNVREGVTAAIQLPTTLLDELADHRNSLRQNAPRITPMHPVDPAPAATPVSARENYWPQSTPIRQSEPTTLLVSGELPQRRPGANGAPTDFTAVSAIAAHDAQPAAPEALPQRKPGASGSASAVTPQAPTTAPQTDGHYAQAEADPPRHRFDHGPITNTASFFSARTQHHQGGGNGPTESDAATLPEPPPVPTDPGAVPPIFSRMVTDWLTDPTSDVSSRDVTPWSGTADEGWVTSRVSFELSPATVTGSGLPVRDRGARLIPGTITPQPEPDRKPLNAEHIRSGLHRHLGGVRRGRHDATEARANTSQPTPTRQVKAEQ